MTSVPDLKVLVWSAWPVQDVGFRNDMFCTVVRCRMLNWLIKPVNGEHVCSLLCTDSLSLYSFSLQGLSSCLKVWISGSFGACILGKRAVTSACVLILRSAV